MFDDAGGFTLLVVLVLVLLAAAFAWMWMRRARHEPSGPGGQDGAGGVPREPESGNGRPVHKDPDPERMAGGRARFTPPANDD